MITELDGPGGDLVSALSSRAREALPGLVVRAAARAGIALTQDTGDPVEFWCAYTAQRRAAQ